MTTATSTDTETTQIGTSMSGANVAILVEYNYEDLELQYPLLRFREEGARTYTVGPNAGTKYLGKHGYPNKCDVGIDNVKLEEIDVLIIPGGWAPDYWRRDKRFTDLVKNCVDQNKIVASICHGPWMHVSSGTCEKRKMTCFASIKDDIKNAGAEYVDEEVVVDGNVITSRTPNDLPAFCRAILKKTNGEIPQKMKNANVAILVEYNYEDLELQYPLLRFREEGARTYTVGPNAGTKYLGKYKYPNKCDVGIDNVKLEEIDVLIIPGGWAPDYWRRDKRFTDLVKNCVNQNKIVASICHGPWMHVSSGTCEKRKMTCFISIKDDIQNAGAEYVDEEVVVDGNIITSRTPNDLPAFCQAILTSYKTATN